MFAATGLNHPSDITFDANGNLYVANVIGFNSVEKFSSTGADLGAFATGIIHPYGLTFDATGNLYVTSSASGTIEKFSPTGADLGVFASSGLGGLADIIAVPTPVPEPAEYAAVAGLALVAFGAWRRTRR